MATTESAPPYIPIDLLLDILARTDVATVPGFRERSDDPVRIVQAPPQNLPPLRREPPGDVRPRGRTRRPRRPPPAAGARPAAPERRL
ncbi:hypothetical protein BDA96_01G075200 [Sorghum bicolor]|uniref:Uncharacterized protein n=1 Tax=Sorghum bicolor TaxID=4558 RepID=A0A921RWE2_SORBI|nr:hypothetical protein BDA96_01G075200 [Sorghum bicolor]